MAIIHRIFAVLIVISLLLIILFSSNRVMATSLGSATSVSRNQVMTEENWNVHMYVRPNGIRGLFVLIDILDDKIDKDCVLSNDTCENTEIRGTKIQLGDIGQGQPTDVKGCIPAGQDYYLGEETNFFDLNTNPTFIQEVPIVAICESANRTTIRKTQQPLRVRHYYVPKGIELENPIRSYDPFVGLAELYIYPNSLKEDIYIVAMNANYIPKSSNQLKFVSNSYSFRTNDVNFESQGTMKLVIYIEQTLTQDQIDNLDIFEWREKGQWVPVVGSKHTCNPDGYKACIAKSVTHLTTFIAGYSVSLSHTYLPMIIR